MLVSDPTATAIIDDLEAWCDERGIEKVTDLIGAVKDDDMEMDPLVAASHGVRYLHVRCHQFSVERGGDGEHHASGVARPGWASLPPMPPTGQTQSLRSGHRATWAVN